MPVFFVIYILIFIVLCCCCCTFSPGTHNQLRRKNRSQSVYQGTIHYIDSFIFSFFSFLLFILPRILLLLFLLTDILFINTFAPSFTKSKERKKGHRNNNFYYYMALFYMLLHPWENER